MKVGAMSAQSLARVHFLLVLASSSQVINLSLHSQCPLSSLTIRDIAVYLTATLVHGIHFRQDR